MSGRRPALAVVMAALLVLTGLAWASWGGPAAAESPTPCRAAPQLLDLGNPLSIARKSMAERRKLRIIALGSSSTQGYGASNPAYAYPAQVKMGLEKALPGIDVEVFNRGIGGQDVEEMAARMRAEMQENPASLVIWQTGTNAAIRQMPLPVFRQKLRDGLALGKSLGADFVLMNLQYVPAVVASPEKDAYEKVMADAAREYDAGLFRRFEIMKSWYQDGMPYAQFVQLDGLHLNDFGQKCIGKLLTKALLHSLNGP